EEGVCLERVENAAHRPRSLLYLRFVHKVVEVVVVRLLRVQLSEREQEERVRAVSSKLLHKAGRLVQPAELSITLAQHSSRGNRVERQIRVDVPGVGHCHREAGQIFLDQLVWKRDV